jgi:Lipid A disaccharide synthetase
LKIGIVSAEPSGDLLGRKILDTLERKFPELTVHGIGDGGGLIK